jgi:DnaJ-class molecular chaperone
MTNHYEILGVSKDADAQEIKKAYRKLSLQYHPDRNPDPEATEKYKAINEAHEILSDPQKREQYNMELQFGSMPNGMQQPGEMNDIFNMMFGGFPGGGFPGGGFPGGGPNIRVFHSGGFPGGGFPGGGIEQLFQQMSRPPPISKQISITLEQAYSGITVQFDIERATIHNNTRVQEIENMTIAIPPGIQENETILINGQGNCGLNNNRGDIHITVKIVNNTIFTRNDMDLTHTKHISLKEALCGFGFEIHHLNGKLINMNNITNPSIIKPNYKKVVPGLGMNKNNQTGNLIIELLVDFPNSLTEQQIEGLRNIL